jgi:hypothetical protein
LDHDLDEVGGIEESSEKKEIRQSPRRTQRALRRETQEGRASQAPTKARKAEGQIPIRVHRLKPVQLGCWPV